jgi:DNA-binding transcriptional ArsR family regulator
MAERGNPFIVKVEVTPRFELFYALQALESGAGDQLGEWRRQMERKLPPRIRTSIVSVAPSPLIWPLLADALRNEPPSIDYPQILAALRDMNDTAFQRCVLGGVFKAPGSVDGLMSGNATLRRIVTTEVQSQERLLSLLGLHPFARDSASAQTFHRIVSDPRSYRAEVITVIESFWDAGFSTTWSTLEPQMRRSASAMSEMVTRSGLAMLARERKLPITQRAGAIVSTTGSTKIPLASILAVHLIPSAFNIARLWAAYPDSHRRTRFFIPVLDPAIVAYVAADAEPSSTEASQEPSLVFKALGDTTRYAMASILARKPMTSVELAHVFGVSKPTISHHVQQLRAAGLLMETQTGNGTVLSLNRRALERASSAAAQEMFSGDGSKQVVRRTRKANRTRQ